MAPATRRQQSFRFPTDNKAAKHHRADARRSPGRSRAHNSRRASSVSWGVLQSSAVRLVHPSTTRTPRGPLARCGKIFRLVSEPVETWGRLPGLGVVGSRMAFADGSLGVRLDVAVRVPGPKSEVGTGHERGD